jgi:hypothetical protein
MCSYISKRLFLRIQRVLILIRLPHRELGCPRRHEENLFCVRISALKKGKNLSKPAKGFMSVERFVVDFLGGKLNAITNGWTRLNTRKPAFAGGLSSPSNPISNYF